MTSAEHNTELKLWSCEQWQCHQTFRFVPPDSDSESDPPILQKMALDLSASFLVLSDIHRKVPHHSMASDQLDSLLLVGSRR